MSKLFEEQEDNIISMPKEEFANYIKEEDAMKFYYIETEDLYLIGKRCGTFYYGQVEYIPTHDTFVITYIMSRYLPWGTEKYPEEPKEITFEDWLLGFIKRLHRKEIKIS